MNKCHFLILIFLGWCFFLFPEGILEDLELVGKINRELANDIPLLYNNSLMVGYLNMPSARMAIEGGSALGGASIPPYSVYGINFQALPRIELSGLYCKNLFKENRFANVKVSLISKDEETTLIPLIAVGAENIWGNKNSSSEYIVATKSFKNIGLELTLGWGRRSIKGAFGGVAWTPFSKKKLTLAAEYDALNYKNLFEEEIPIKTRINGAVYYSFGNAFQISVGTVRGEEIFGKLCATYPLGLSSGFLAKTKDPPLYSHPINLQQLGVERRDVEFGRELAFALKNQGFELFYAIIEGKDLWISMSNNRYRKENIIRERLQNILASLLPANIETIKVTIESLSLPCFTYIFEAKNLNLYRDRLMGDTELAVLSPRLDYISPPAEANFIFSKKRSLASIALMPNIKGFFRSSDGTFEYALGGLVSQDGFLPGDVYYKIRGGYTFASSNFNEEELEEENPSQLVNVRTDSLEYYPDGKFFLEKAFLQKNFNMGKGFFFKLAGGYFEIAYMGGATEFLYSPVRNNFAIGLELATVWKRKYEGLGVTERVRKMRGSEPEYVHFIGLQYFLDFYYALDLPKLDLKLSLGQFLAKDIGGRFEVSKNFSSGVRLSLWYTITNAKDMVNGRIYYDKGFKLSIPLDLFMRRSSKDTFDYSMSAMQRDVGAISETGMGLYNIIEK